MSRLVLVLAMLATALIPPGAHAQEDGLKAAVAISLQQEGKIWSGQQVTLNLDLKTTGFSFSNTHFNLPEVGDAFLMQTDTTTIKLSERKDGEDWQVIRYPLALYPLKSGPLSIPPIDVRFSSSAGYGTTARDFEFQTEPLQLTVSLPPGVAANELVVSTRSFQLEHDWQGKTGKAKTGDAVTLTVKRRAGDISAMLLPPLPVYETDGLAAYPQTPGIVDKTDRGSLTGERSDSIIWVAERAGSYEIPGIRFQWWDPLGEELKRQVIPGIRLDIAPSPGDRPADVPGANAQTRPGKLLAWLSAALVVILGAALWRGFEKQRERAPRGDEESAYLSLQKACKGHRAGEAYAAMHTWLACRSPAGGSRTRPATLLEFARSLNDAQLGKDLLELQTALAAQAGGWRGQALLASIKRVRREGNDRQSARPRVHLAPLNP